MKKIILFLMLLCGCSTYFWGEPKNITNRELYQQHHNWCLNYGAVGKTPVYTESYKTCMERYGYQY